MRVKVDLVRRFLQQMMMDQMGFRRFGAKLEEAQATVGRMAEFMDARFDSPGGFELQNMVMLAAIMIQAARLRQESRGCHFRVDFPEVDDWRWRKHICFELAGDRLDASTRDVGALSAGIPAGR